MEIGRVVHINQPTILPKAAVQRWRQQPPSWFLGESEGFMRDISSVCINLLQNVLVALIRLWRDCEQHFPVVSSLTDLLFFPGQGPFVVNPSHSALCIKEALRAQDSNTDLIEVPKVSDCVPPTPKMSIESDAYRGSLIKPFQEIRGRYKKWMNVSRNPFRVAVLSWAQYREENQRYTVLSTCVAPTSKIGFRSAIHSEPFLRPFRQIRNYRKWRKLCKKTFRGEVFLWARDSGNYHRYTAYYDTGSSGNFIRRRVVEELGLETTRGGSTEFSGLDGNTVTVQDSVMPKWEMTRSGRKFEDIVFHVVEEIPQGLDMILGEGFLIERKVVKMALPNFFDRTSKKYNTKEADRYREQISDGNAYRTQRLENLTKEGSQSIQKQSTTGTTAQGSNDQHRVSYK